MKLNKLFFLMSFVIAMIACESETEKPEMKITIGTVCGWCAGSDSLVISRSKTTYTLGAICDRKEKVISKQTSVSEWNELMAIFDQRKFGAININSCDVCADGCDTWIRVENGSFSHEIRFGYEDSAILVPIKEFVERLETMKNHYK